MLERNMVRGELLNGKVPQSSDCHGASMWTPGAACEMGAALGRMLRSRLWRVVAMPRALVRSLVTRVCAGWAGLDGQAIAGVSRFSLVSGERAVVVRKRARNVHRIPRRTAKPTEPLGRTGPELLIPQHLPDRTTPAGRSNSNLNPPDPKGSCGFKSRPGHQGDTRGRFSIVTLKVIPGVACQSSP